MSESTITISLSVAASPEYVFRAGPTSSSSRRGGGPTWPARRTTSTRVPAAAPRISSPAIGATVTGVFTEVDAPRRLVFTWSWEDDGEPDAVVEDTVVVTFEPADEGTLVTVASTSVAHEPEGGAEQGWNDVMERLVQLYDPEGSAGVQSTSSRS